MSRPTHYSYQRGCQVKLCDSIMSMSKSEGKSKSTTTPTTTTKARILYRNGTVRLALGVRGTTQTGDACWKFTIAQPSKVEHVDLAKDDKILSRITLSCACAAAQTSQVICWLI